MAVWRDFIEDAKKNGTVLKFMIKKENKFDEVYTGKLLAEDDHFYLIEKYEWDRSVDEYVSTGNRQIIAINQVYSIMEKRH